MNLTYSVWMTFAIIQLTGPFEMKSPKRLTLEWIASLFLTVGCNALDNYIWNLNLPVWFS
jgi:hypothetical protein